MVGWKKKQMDGGWMDRKKNEKNMDGQKKMDGWMDKKNRWMVGWIKK